MTLAFLPNLGWPEMLIIGVVMLLLFGRRLPEVGRSLGQGLVQFKKGLKDIGDEVETQANKPDTPRFESAKAPASDHDRVAQAEPGKTEASS